LLKFSGTIFCSRSSFREPLFPAPRRLQKLKLMRLLDAKTVCLWKSKFDIDRRFKVQPGLQAILQAILHKAPVLFKVVWGRGQEQWRAGTAIQVVHAPSIYVSSKLTYLLGQSDHSCYVYKIFFKENHANHFMLKCRVRVYILSTLCAQKFSPVRSNWTGL
jgi:hypothetical protein